MKPNITVTEVESDNVSDKRIVISGAENHDDARNAAEEWCENHNSRILNFIQEDPYNIPQDSPQIYYAVISSK
jgi:hypothetical protein